MKFVLPYDHVLNTLTGHAIEFKAGEPTFVPEVARKAAIDFGAVPEGTEAEAPAEGEAE